MNLLLLLHNTFVDLVYNKFMDLDPVHNTFVNMELVHNIYI